jgi:hypothetical protein
MKLFHVERRIKTLFTKGFLVFLIVAAMASCITPRHTVEIHDYILVPNGKPVLGREKGLTAFIFENNPRKIPFQQFLADKYQVGKYEDVAYWITVDGHRLKVLLYENAELEKYFVMSDFMVTNVEPEMAIVGSNYKFIGLSVMDENNEDCLSDQSLYKNMTADYLKSLKDEFNNL